MTKRKDMIDFNKMWIDFECPNCGYKDEVQIIDVKTEKRIYCHNCKIIIELVDSDASTHTSIHSMTNALKDFEKTLKNFGK